MNDTIKKVIETLIPFIIIGVAIALFVGLLFMFFYIALWGLLIGGVLWLAAMAKNYFFPAKATTSPKDQGRIIEHNDKK